MVIVCPPPRARQGRQGEHLYLTPDWGAWGPRAKDDDDDEDWRQKECQNSKHVFFLMKHRTLAAERFLKQNPILRKTNFEKIQSWKIKGGRIQFLKIQPKILTEGTKVKNVRHCPNFDRRYEGRTKVKNLCFNVGFLKNELLKNALLQNAFLENSFFLQKWVLF